MAFREKRWTLREFSYDHSKANTIDTAITVATEALKDTRSTTLRWCKTHFGEVFSAYLHLKVIQGFVESVLRYGLPIDFISFFVEPDIKVEKELKQQLVRTVVKIRPELKIRKGLADEEDEEESIDSLPFVYLPFTLVGSNVGTTASSATASAT
jgi:V-type H+-transporting ATPase subunit C